MMRKIFLILICLNFFNPAYVFANSGTIFEQNSQDMFQDTWQEQVQQSTQEQQSREQSQEPKETLPEEQDAVQLEETPQDQEQESQEAPQEEIQLFASPENTTTEPFSTFSDAQRQSRTIIKSGIKMNEERSPIMNTSKDGSVVTFKSKKKDIGEFLFGNVSSGKPVSDDYGGFMGYRKGRFAIANSVERNDFRPELARSSVAVEPEFQLTQNLKLKTSFRSVQFQPGTTEGVALEYGKTNSRFKKFNNLKMEVKATTSTTPDSDPVRRFGFNTRYYF